MLFLNRVTLIFSALSLGLCSLDLVRGVESVELFDLTGRVRVGLPGTLFLVGSYYYQGIELDADGVEASVEFSGAEAVW